MADILIVDDSLIDRRLARGLLEKGLDARVIEAVDGEDALEKIGAHRPAVVVTDLQMPNLDGLQLVLMARAKFPLVPVILMTAHGSEELAIQALRQGAASYVPKKNLARHLVETVESFLETSQVKRDQQRLGECVRRTETRYELPNDPSLIAPLVAGLKDNLFRMCGSDDTGLVRVTTALREAILNAMEHGNLELSSDLRERDDDSYHQLAAQRRADPKYKDRMVFVTSRETPTEATYVIEDQGPGFDITKLPDPFDPANLEKRSGRGLLLIRTFMNEVRHNATGNEITLVWRPSSLA